MRRLYFLFPDRLHCKQMVDQLLLKHIDFKHMHVVAKEDMDLSGLPEASLSQKYDLRHSFWVGLIAGTFLGIGIGIAFHIYLNLPWGGLMIVTMIIGALLGAWASTMIGIAAPNVELQPFSQAIEQGQLLLMVDVPQEQVHEIEALTQRTHPEATAEGVEPTIPPFP